MTKSGLDNTHHSNQIIVEGVKLLIIATIPLHSFALFLNTPSGQVDYLEFAKFFCQFIGLGAFAVVSKHVQLIIIRTLILILTVHIILAVALTYDELNYFLTRDPSRPRIVFLGLGRTPGDTAQAFTALFIVSVLFAKNASRAKKIFLQILRIVAFIMVGLTQTRTMMLVLLIFLTGIFLEKFGYLKIKSYLFILLLFLTLPIVFATSDPAALSKISSGRYDLWVAFLNDFSQRDVLDFWFSTDLSRREVVVPEMNYETSDVHNTFFDIMNYFGLFGLILVVLFYLISTRCFNSNISLIVFLSYLPVLFLSCAFKYPGTFYVSLLFLMLPIYFSSAGRSKHDYQNI
tara:strand:- start:13020 stop:14057 length:1038 start_codon:yes stop_codon:yes gene_type:complete